MKTIPSYILLSLLLLTACTADDVPGAGPAPLHISSATLSGPANVQVSRAENALTHGNGEIWIEVDGKTAWYQLDGNGNLTLESGQPTLTIPRTQKQAEAVKAYGYVLFNISGTSFYLPIHATAQNYPVTWNTDDEANHTATLNGPLKLSPAVALLHITVQDAAGSGIGGFNITGENIYRPAGGNIQTNWQEDPAGNYQIKPRSSSYLGWSQEDILIVPATLKAGDAMFRITGRNDAPTGYQNKTWTVHVHPALTRLEAGTKYNLTVTLEGTKAAITGTTITDWEEGDATYKPKGYDHAVYNWEELVEALVEASIHGENVTIIQMKDITAPEDQGSRTPQYFYGLYNGNGHTISGLKAPLFDWVSNGSQVYNLHLRDCNVTVSSGNHAGLLANGNSGTITLCSATGTLQHTYSSVNYTGGLVGTNHGFITRCYTNARVENQTSTGWVYAGGLAGYNDGSIVACAAWGTVTVNANNTNATAGNLVGMNYTGTIAYSYATAKGKAIGDHGSGDGIIVDRDVSAYTLVPSPTSPTGITEQWRSFGADGNWWSASPYKIDFTYEGKP